MSPAFVKQTQNMLSVSPACPTVSHTALLAQVLTDINEWCLGRSAPRTRQRAEVECDTPSRCLMGPRHSHADP